MAALLPITGTVSVTLDGCDEVGLGTFSIPTPVTVDAETGIVTLWAAPRDAILTAMAESLKSAADQILATIPNAAVETVEGSRPRPVKPPTIGPSGGAGDSGASEE